MIPAGHCLLPSRFFLASPGVPAGHGLRRRRFSSALALEQALTGPAGPDLFAPAIYMPTRELSGADDQDGGLVAGVAAASAGRSA